MIEVYVAEIKKSLHNKCYFPALALALTLLDMCGMAEYPREDVGKRYVNWYEKYIGEFMKQSSYDTPWLSGEVVYNLRNTFLHQGSPNIDANKVKEPINKLDKFILLLGDGTVINQVSSSMVVGTGDDAVEHKAILVDVTYLCNSLCDFSLWYYEKYKERFSFDFDCVTQEQYLMGKASEEVIDVVVDLLNRSKE